MIVFKWSLRFSVYLRQHWNMSHFTVAILPLVIDCAHTATYMDTLWFKVLYVFAVATIIWGLVYNASIHNRPANVEPRIPQWVALMSVAACVVFSPVNILSGDFLRAVTGVCGAAAFVLASTPGYKIPHEPDNLNYSPSMT